MDSISAIAVWVLLGAGIALVLYGLNVILTHWAWLVRWKRGDSKQMKISAKLGWNTGTPPVGVLFLVREHMKSFPKKFDPFLQNYGWALMKSDGERAYSVSGGFSTPITNITGWMECTLPEGVS